MATATPPQSSQHTTETFRQPVSYSRYVTYSRWFPVALTIFLLWIVALVILCVSTANPPILNRVQIIKSDIVVVATYDPQTDGMTHTIHKALLNRTSAELPARIKILREDESAREHRERKDLIYPLRRSASGQWTVTPANVPKHPGITYPDTPELRQQIESLQ